MPQWKRVTSGKYVDLLDFKPEDVNLLDIETALNRIVRFTGHGEIQPLTVAQHSWLCWQLASRDHPTDYELQLAVLLHDAAEAYIGDVATPVKKALGSGWYDFAGPIERAVEQALLPAYTEDDEVLKAKVKYYDAMSLDIERRALWKNQRGKDKWPSFSSSDNLSRKLELFQNAQFISWVGLEAITLDLWAELNKTINTEAA